MSIVSAYLVYFKPNDSVPSIHYLHSYEQKSIPDQLR